MGLFIILVFGAYLLGSIPFGLLISRLFKGVDIRQVGSGNIGATNVLRMVGRVPGAITLFLDGAKGFLPVIAMRWVGGSEAWVTGAGLAALLGHLYPVFLGFKGGKGVATGFGALLGAMPMVAIFGVGIWVGVALVWRYASLAAMVAASCIPFLVWLFDGRTPYFLFSGILAFFIIYRHQENIRRLLAGIESRIGQKITADG